jgi:hypothetical protein
MFGLSPQVVHSCGGRSNACRSTFAHFIGRHRHSRVFSRPGLRHDGRVSEERRSIARICTSVTFDDGTAMTWTADNPLRPSFEISGPHLNPGPLEPEALYLIPEPEPWRFAVAFQANFRARGLAFTAVPPGEAVTLSRADLRQVYEYARHFDVDDDSAMIRVRSALALPRERPSP